MPKLLHLAASPRRERSFTLAVAAAFTKAYRDRHPADTVETIDLWSTELPSFDGAALAAKYAVLGGEEHTAEQASAWAGVRAVVDRFKSADKLLISVPMWNFGIPYALKHYIDVITQPGLTFAWTQEHGFEGLVTGRPALLIHSSAAAYHQGSGWEASDFERPYLETWLRFIGFTDIRSITVAPTLQDAESVKAAQETGLRAAIEIADLF